MEYFGILRILVVEEEIGSIIRINNILNYMDTNEGFRQVAVSIPNSLYRKIKEKGIVMSAVMKKALEEAVEKEEKE